MKKETVGKISSKLKEKEKDNTHTPIDQMRKSLTDYEKNIQEAVDSGKKEFDKEFYIVVITKKERLMDNVLRNYFTCRKSCPTPEYDQATYRYTRKDDQLKLLWVVPARDVCNFFVDNMLSCPPEQKELLGYVLDFKDGTLLKLSRRLNGECVS